MTDREAIDVLFNEWKCIDRNDGIHCDRKCESCDLVMDVWIIREAFNMAISALQAQDSPKPTAESVQNVQNEDLISRKAAIDALDALCDRECEYSKKQRSVMCGACHLGSAFDVIEQLPSAQPERKTGHWLIREGISDAQCSECGMYFNDVYDMDNSDAFCRQCGTKMEGLKVVEDE